MESNSIHIPVLPVETIRLLNLKSKEVVVDATVGDGGHAKLMLEKIGPGGYLIGIDRDPEAVTVAYENLSSQKSNAKFITVHGSFADLGDILEDAGHRGVDAILFDLGLSSRELSSSRGFSFQSDASLDMRFDPMAPLTAEEIVNSYPKERLANLIYELGEERASRRIADAIFITRQKHRITTTKELAEIVSTAKGGRHSRIHPATQTFQALRIAVNDELQQIKIALPLAIQLLNPNGRIAVISYHSLEDRIVKNVFRDAKGRGDVRLITKKPIVPQRDEIIANPRARSAKLRVIAKLN